MDRSRCAGSTRRHRGLASHSKSRQRKEHKGRHGCVTLSASQVQIEALRRSERARFRERSCGSTAACRYNRCLRAARRRVFRVPQAASGCTGSASAAKLPRKAYRAAACIPGTPAPAKQAACARPEELRPAMGPERMRHAPRRTARANRHRCGEFLLRCTTAQHKPRKRHPMHVPRLCAIFRGATPEPVAMDPSSPGASERQPNAAASALLKRARHLRFCPSERLRRAPQPQRRRAMQQRMRAAHLSDAARSARLCGVLGASSPQLDKGRVPSQTWQLAARALSRQTLSALLQHDDKRLATTSSMPDMRAR